MLCLRTRSVPAHAVQGSSTLGTAFASALLAMLPKKDLFAISPEVYGLQVFDLRPISIHTSSFRVIYSAFARSFMKIVPSCVDEGQIGFLRGTEEHILVADSEVHIAARLGMRAGHLLADVERAFRQVLGCA